jgi:amino acid transporter
VQREDNGGSREGITGPSAGLGLWDAVSIIIGIVIGAGIYETAPLVFANVSSPAAGLMVWIAGGVLSLVGAACYAELASTYPRSGGDYVYLTKAFGPLSGFLFGWAQLTVILTGSIGMMAYVFADYAVALFGFGAGAGVALAASAVLALTLLNVMGASLGKKAQNVLSLVKLLGVLGVVVTGVAVAAQGLPELPAKVRIAGEAAPGVSLGLAMILVLYTFGGWNDAAFVAAEVRNRKRNLPRALLLGTAAITLIYVAMNAAFLFALGFERARSSEAIARDLFVTAFGPAGGAAISLLVMISALGAVNALIFTGSRLHATLGVDYSALSRLGVWHAKMGSPVAALVVQMAITLTMVALVGTLQGRAWIDGALTSVGLSPARWSGHGGFDTLLSCTAPVFWLFFLLTGASLFRLRQTDPARPRPFRVPLYPVTPLLFCATCAYMLYSSVVYAGTLTLVGIAPLVLGVPVYFASKRKPAASRAMPEPAVSGAE